MNSTATPARKRRNTVRVPVDAATRERLDELSDRYGSAVGMITREAITAGLACRYGTAAPGRTGQRT